MVQLAYILSKDDYCNLIHLYKEIQRIANGMPECEEREKLLSKAAIGLFILNGS